MLFDALYTILGGFLGGAIGVICDRLWRRYEDRVVIKVSVSTCSSEDFLAQLETPARNGTVMGVQVHAINEGLTVIPPCELYLKKGWMSQKFTQSVNQLDWLPEQSRTFEFPVFVGGHPVPRGYDFFEGTGFDLRLVKANSNRVLWHSQKMGDSLALLILLYHRYHGSVPESQLSGLTLIARSKSPWQLFKEFYERTTPPQW